MISVESILFIFTLILTPSPLKYIHKKSFNLCTSIYAAYQEVAATEREEETEERQ